MSPSSHLYRWGQWIRGELRWLTCSDCGWLNKAWNRRFLLSNSALSLLQHVSFPAMWPQLRNLSPTSDISKYFSSINFAQNIEQLANHLVRLSPIILRQIMEQKPDTSHLRKSQYLTNSTESFLNIRIFFRIYRLGVYE